MMASASQVAAVFQRAATAILGLLAAPLAAYNLYGDVRALGWISPTVLYTLLMALTATTAGALALVVTLRASSTPANRVFALFLGALGLGLAIEQGAPLLPRSWSNIIYFGAVATGLAATLRLSQLFPRPLEPAAVRAARGPSVMRALQARMMGPLPIWAGVGAGSWLLLIAAYAWMPGAVVLQMGLVLTGLTSATSYLLVAYARGDSAERERIFWFIEAGLVTIVALVLGSWVEVALHIYGVRTPLVVWSHAVIFPVGLLGMVVVFAFAVLYKGALDSRLVVRRTVVYAATGFTLTLLFVGIETVIEDVLASRLLPERAGGYIAGLIAALVFGPLRTAVERRVSLFQPQTPRPSSRTPPAPADPG